MSQIQDLDQTELERSLPERLRRSAAAVAPAPDALSTVRARAAGRRRRSRLTVMAASAAAVAVIAAGVAVVTGDDPSTGLTAGPADGGPSTVTTPVPAEALDATLVVYRYPNATPEMIEADPKMGGEWAMLFTDGRVYFANGPVEALGTASPWNEFDLDAAIAAIDATSSRTPAEIAEALSATGYGVPGQVPTAPVPFGDDGQVTGMIELIATGSLGADRAATLTGVLWAMPGVEVQHDGATVTVSSAAADSFVTYRVQDGRPLRKGSLAVPTAQMEYLSVTPVRASDVLVPGRGTPNTQTTTTTVPG